MMKIKNFLILLLSFFLHCFGMDGKKDFLNLDSNDLTEQVNFNNNELLWNEAIEKTQDGNTEFTLNIADIYGNKIGRIIYIKNVNGFYISLIDIELKYRNKGIGSFLLKHLCNKLLKSSKMSEIYLFPSPQDYNFVKVNNTYDNALKRLINFYKRIGFTKEHGCFLYYVEE